MRVALAAVLAAVVLVLGGCGGQPDDATTQTQPKAVEPCSNGYVALTYDDGPTEFTTPLVDALIEHDMKATFFMLGSKVVQMPEAARYAAERFPIGNHSYDHPHMQQMSHRAIQDEIRDTSKVIKEHTGVAPGGFRPPYGESNVFIRNTARAQGMTEVIWTLDTRDWEDFTHFDAETALADVKDGDVVLMHDDSQADVDAVPEIARILSEKGLCSSTLRPSEKATKAWYGVFFHAEVARP